MSRDSTQHPVGSTVPANSVELQEAGLRSPPASLPVSVFPTARDEDESTMFDAHVSPVGDRSDNGRVTDFAKPVFRRFRLFNQGAQVPHVSRSVEGTIDESMQDVRGSDSVGTFPVNEGSSGVGSSGEKTNSINGREESVEGDDAMVDVPLEDSVEMDFPRAMCQNSSTVQNALKFALENLVGGVASRTWLEASHIDFKDAPPSASRGKVHSQVESWVDLKLSAEASSMFCSCETKFVTRKQQFPVVGVTGQVVWIWKDELSESRL